MSAHPFLSLLAALLILGGCSGEEPEPEPGAYLAQADTAFAAGEAAQAGGDMPAAVGAWADAGDAYRHAFRLMDPQAEAAPQRALVAFRAARSLAKAALHGTAPEYVRFRAQLALTWLDEAERLAPSLRQVHYERARLFDSNIPSVTDFMAAFGAYTRYLQLVGAEQVPSESERPRVEHARTRVAALGPHDDTTDK
ncbi:MAG: hypothetical protein O2894_12750 [Planctomycetota bacterium]|nr:hypothetical protein [Planctomycetota bacterium]